MNKPISTKERSLEYPPLSREAYEKELYQEGVTKRALTLLFVSAVVFGITIGIFVFNFTNNSIVNREENREVQILGEEEEKKDIQFELINKIAYIKANNIWVFTLEDRENIQITSEGGSGITYPSFAWRNRDELTFSKCTNALCTVQTFSFKEKTIIDLFEVKSTIVKALRWSHKGDSLAYLFRDQGKLYLTIKGNEVLRNLGKFAEEEGRAYDFYDARYIRFSPDDKKLMIVNTFVPEGSPTITVIDNSGEIVVSLNKTKESFATFGFFMSNETIYYKKEEYLYVRSLETGEETKLNERIVGAFNFQPSPDKSKLSYWTYDWLSGVSTIWIYEIGTSDLKRFRDQESFPVWANNEILISFKTSDCRKCLLGKIEVLGVSKIDLVSKNVEMLGGLADAESLNVDNF